MGSHHIPGILLQFTREHQVGVGRRLIVNQPVDLRLHGDSGANLIVHPWSVDADLTTIRVPDFHASGVDVESAGK